MAGEAERARSEVSTMIYLYAFLAFWFVRSAMAAFKYKIIVEITVHDIAVENGLKLDLVNLRLQRSEWLKEFLYQLFLPIRKPRRFGDGNMAIVNTITTPTVRDVRDREHLPYVSLAVVITSKSKVHPGRFLVYGKGTLSVVSNPEQ
jgi:hypothetical protein